MFIEKKILLLLYVLSFCHQNLFSKNIVNNLTINSNTTKKLLSYYDFIILIFFLQSSKGF